MIGDLHCHTRLSDGSLGIDDLLFHAKRAGLDFVSVTDHDTMSGVTRAEVLGKRYGLHVIPGVEISAMDYERAKKVHILCYLPKNPDRLEKLLSKSLASRDKAGKEMLARAMKIYPISPEHVARYSMGSKALYKAHIMNAIIDLGYDNRIFGDVFHKLFDAETGSCFVPMEYPDVFDVLNLVKESGGVAVLAHPSHYKTMELFEQLSASGQIEGVELFHKSCTPSDGKTIEQIASKYGLILTGGSDFHGYYSSKPEPLGAHVTTKSSLDALFRLNRTLKNYKDDTK